MSSWKVNSFYPVHYEYVYNNLMLFEKIAFKYDYFVDRMLFELKFKKYKYFHRAASKVSRLPAIAIKKIFKKLIINKHI